MTFSSQFITVTYDPLQTQLGPNMNFFLNSHSEYIYVIFQVVFRQGFWSDY